MKIIFYINERTREIAIAKHLQEGAKKHNIDFQIIPKRLYGKGQEREGPDVTADVAMAYGVKSASLLKEHCLAGMNWVILDKGYIRRPGPHGVELYTRVSVNETYPLDFFHSRPDRPPDRWKQLGIDLKDERAPRDTAHVVVAGSSQKFYEYFNCGNERKLHSEIIKRLRGVMNNNGLYRPIVFRPKPSYEQSHPGVEEFNAFGADYVSLPNESIQDALAGAHCLVTFASNAACDAVFNGIPVITIGPHVTNPMAYQSLYSLEDVTLPKMKARRQWAYNLAYEQWTLQEMANGTAWDDILMKLRRGPIQTEWHQGLKWAQKTGE